MLLSFCCFWNSIKLQKGSFMIDPWSVPLPFPLQSSDSWMFVKENPYKKIVEWKRTRRNHYQIVLLAIFDWRHLKWCTEFVGNKVKGRISKRLFQENKARQIFRKTNISCPLIRTPQRVGDVRFSKNLACFVFLKHPFWDSPFCLITDELIETIGKSDVVS